MASFNFLKGANSTLQETHSSAIMVGRRRQDERKQCFPITACFACSWGGQSWGWALFGCGSLWWPGTDFLNPAGWAPGLQPAHPGPLPCSSSRQKRIPLLSLSSKCENHLPDRGAAGPGKGQLLVTSCDQTTTFKELKTAMAALGREPGKVSQGR